MGSKRSRIKTSAETFNYIRRQGRPVAFFAERSAVKGKGAAALHATAP